MRNVPFVAGLRTDMAAADYHAVEAMSNGGAKKILQSPAHYRLMRTTPNVPSAPMQFGTAVHDGALEPEAFDSRVVVAPECDKRSNAGKQLWAEFTFDNEGKTVLSRPDFDRARRCIDAVLAHPTAAFLLRGAEVEHSLFWEDGQYKVPCKARIDARNHGAFIDLKTTKDASPTGFARQAADLLYHLQGAHYMSGGEHVLNATPEFFGFIAVESEEPHAVACYQLPPIALHRGRHHADEALARYRDALAAGAWPGYAEQITELNLPRWALRLD